MIRFLEIESHNESMGQLMGQWVLGQWVNGSWVSDTMGHGSPMVTHDPPCPTDQAELDNYMYLFGSLLDR